MHLTFTIKWQLESWRRLFIWYSNVCEKYSNSISKVFYCLLNLPSGLPKTPKKNRKDFRVSRNLDRKTFCPFGIPETSSEKHFALSGFPKTISEKHFVLSGFPKTISGKHFALSGFPKPLRKDFLRFRESRNWVEIKCSPSGGSRNYQNFEVIL